MIKQSVVVVAWDVDVEMDVEEKDEDGFAWILQNE